MSYSEYDEMGEGFRLDGDEDEPVDVPDEATDLGLDEEDPDKDS